MLEVVAALNATGVGGNNLVDTSLEKLTNVYQIKPGPAENILQYITKLKAAAAA